MEKENLNVLNYKKSDKELIEKIRYKYYDFTEEIINGIIEKSFEDVTDEEWRILIQMLYPHNLVASGLFQPYLIFNIDNNGKRIDPPIKAFDSITSKRGNSCLLLDIMNILTLKHCKCNASWYIKKRELDL